jgi:hypothetical protein
MAEIIIFQNDNGNVSVTVPTGEISIQEVQAKDCPIGSIIVDDSTLPQGADSQFFDAWELSGSTVFVNINKAKTSANINLNVIAKIEASHRATNVGIGIENKLTDAGWLSLLTIVRNNISNSNTTQELLIALKLVQNAIADNI